MSIYTGCIEVEHNHTNARRTSMSHPLLQPPAGSQEKTITLTRHLHGQGIYIDRTFTGAEHLDGQGIYTERAFTQTGYLH